MFEQSKNLRQFRVGITRLAAEFTACNEGSGLAWIEWRFRYNSDLTLLSSKNTRVIGANDSTHSGVDNRMVF